MLPRLTGAILRATLVAALIAFPSMVLPATSADTALMASFLALSAFVLTLVEYNSAAPSFIEFRDAPPFNRLRFLVLYVTVFTLCVMIRDGSAPTTLTRIAAALGRGAAELADVPYSPVRLMVLTLPESTSASAAQHMRSAAAVAYMWSMAAVAGFAVILRLSGWPTRGRVFNLWINLPTFEPTALGDPVERLRRDANINMVLGFLLPFVVPAIMQISGGTLVPLRLSDPHAIVWIVTIWAFVPASLLMRGIALGQLCRSLEAQRDHSRHQPTLAV